MKKNKLILSVLLFGFCLFSMGSSCGGDVEQPNNVDAQQASDAPKEEAKAKESAEDETLAEVKADAVKADAAKADDKQELAGVSQELAEAQQAQKKAEEDTLADVHAAVRAGKLKEAQALLGSSEILARCYDTKTAEILALKNYKLDKDLNTENYFTPAKQQATLRFYSNNYPDEDFPDFEQETYFAAYMTAPGEKDFTVHFCWVL